MSIVRKDLAKLKAVAERIGYEFIGVRTCECGDQSEVVVFELVDKVGDLTELSSWATTLGYQLVEGEDFPSTVYLEAVTI